MRTPLCLDILHRFRLLDERLGLAAFDALAEELVLPRVHGRLRFRNAWGQSRGDALREVGFLLSGNPVRDLAGPSAGRNQPPPPGMRKRDLSDIAGTWQEDPAFDSAIAEQQKIDEAMWR